MRWLDTKSGWDYVVSCWQSTFSELGITQDDRCFFPFSFGPFLGFWSAFEACLNVGAFCVSGGGMTSSARLKMIHDNQITTLFCTPTYALHLLESAKQESRVPTTVRTIVVAGEPGGNIAETKKQIQSGWNASVLDHYGLTEVGPVAFEPRTSSGFLTLLEDKVLIEIVKPNSEEDTQPGEIGELVVTSFGRPDSPLIRYRTGDLVKLSKQFSRQGFRILEGGIIGRADDMIHVRGNNLYPSAIEAVIRQFHGIAEFQIVVSRKEALTDISINIELSLGEDAKEVVSNLGRKLKDEFLFRIDVFALPSGSLPRFEMKAKRVVFVQK
jgi:phenylacetate-CoA ligase